jgi:thiol:disulfide interchange protein DsbC
MKPFLSACTLAVFLALFLSAPAEAFRKEPAASKGCAECHKLTKEEAGKILAKMVDNVVGVVQGPFPGVWEVDVARSGKTYPIYLDYSLKYLLNGQFIRLADMENLTGLRYQDLNRVDVASIPVQDAIRVGSPSAKKTVIVLSDPTCAYCVKLHGEIKKAAAKDADVAFLVMPYPRNRNDKATYRNCLAVVCSKSEKALDDAYAGKELPAPSCKSDAVDETMKLADRLKIQGTPTMILPDGRVISGSMEAGALLSLLNGGR